MKMIWCLMLAAFCSLALPASSLAEAPAAIRVLSADSFKNRSKAGKEEGFEIWAYRVVLQNNSNRDLTDLEIRYRIFHYDEFDADGKSLNPLLELDGKIAVPALKKQEKKTVNTEDMEFSTGGSRVVKADRDVWKGIWVRVFDKEGRELGALVKPASFAKTHPWK